MSRQSHLYVCFASLLVCGLTLTLTWAQYQVNPQINMGGNAQGGSVQYPAAYANQVSQSPGQNVTQNPMMASQLQFVNQQSGNLQSQIRYSNMAAGPLAGQQVQVPQNASNLAPRKSAPLPPAQSPASVRYANSPPPSNAMNAQISGQVNGQIGGQVSGSVRY